MFKCNKWFTLVELIVVITILSILSTIAYISFIGYQISARDSIRVSDVNNITKVIELYDLKTSKFPSVSGEVNITFSWANIWEQWIFWNESYVDAKRISEVPKDPLTKSSYMYSRTNATSEYQVWGILEKVGSAFLSSTYSDVYAADDKKNFSANIVRWNYNGKFIVHTEDQYYYILWVPSILGNTIEDVELNYLIDNDLFLYDGKKVIPPSFSWALSEVGIGWNFDPAQSQDSIDEWYSGIIYIWDKNDLESFDGKRDFITNLKNYYTPTDALDDRDLLSKVDISNENKAVQIANNYIDGWIWGFENLEIETSDLKVNEYSWVSDVWWSCDATPTWSWWSGWWSCSLSCGWGTQDRTRTCINTWWNQNRTVTCQRTDGTIVADSNCIEPKPNETQACSEWCTGNASESQSCNTQACFTYSWDIASWWSCDANPMWTWWSGWSGCSVSCGGWTQSRTRSCTNTDGNETRSVTCLRSDGATVADSFCTEPKPNETQACSNSCTGTASESQSCNTHSCYTYSWYTSAWWSCSGEGTSPWSWWSCNCATSTRSRPIYSTPWSQSRSVYCQRSDGASVSDVYCAWGKPSSSQSCGWGSIINTEFWTCSCPCSGALLASCTEYYCPATGGMTCWPAAGCPSTWVNTWASCPAHCSWVQTSPTTWHCQ